MDKDPLAETRAFVRYLSQMESLSQIPFPKVGESVTGFWANAVNYGENTKWGVILGSVIWPLYSSDGLNLADKVGNGTRYGNGWKETTKEWLLLPTEALIDYNEYALIISEMMKEGSGLFVLGFFLSKKALYNADERHNYVARNGKMIERTVEVSSSSSRTGKKWTVLVYRDGTKSCNCPSWIFHNTEHGGNCKHTLKVK